MATRKVVTADPVLERARSAKRTASFDLLEKVGTKAILKRLNLCEGSKEDLGIDVNLLGAILNDDIELFIVGGAAATVKATELNAAPVDTFFKSVVVQLREKVTGNLVRFGKFQSPVLTPTKVVADGTVPAPTVVGSPVFADGMILAKVKFGTGTGTYVADDTVSVEVQINAGNSWIGGGTIASVTREWTVV